MAPRLLIVLAALGAVTAQAGTPAAAPATFEARLLAAHNAERQRLGIAPLVWDAELARQAGQWAATLAARRQFEHSRDRGGAGENLWMGTSGAYSPEQMVGGFVSEGRYFRPGRFPQVSSTGTWWSVGHYTQLIWPATRALGCARASGGGNDYLVCRYFPAGNVIGQRVP